MIELGTMVEIAKHSAYRNKYVGFKGVVKNSSSNNVGVELFGKRNNASSYGWFWFSPSDLIIIKDKECESMITGNFKVAVVHFLDGTNSSSGYEYALFDNFEIGDVCVVKSANHGFGVARIVNIIDRADATTKNFEREVVDRFYMSNYENRIENRAKAKKLKAEMDEKMKELQDIALYQMMAEKFPELQAMLDEYQSLL